MEPNVRMSTTRTLHLAPRNEAIRLYYCQPCVCWFNQWQTCQCKPMAQPSTGGST